jgi:hypothetical protein
MFNFFKKPKSLLSKSSKYLALVKHVMIGAIFVTIFFVLLEITYFTKQPILEITLRNLNLLVEFISNLMKKMFTALFQVKYLILLEHHLFKLTRIKLILSIQLSLMEKIMLILNSKRYS